MANNEIMNMVLGELRGVGVRAPIISASGRRFQVRWPSPKGLRVFTVAGSASDRRAVDNARADVRRMLRADGMLASGAEPAEKPDRALSKIEKIEQRLRRVEQLVADLRAPDAHAAHA